MVHLQVIVTCPKCYQSVVMQVVSNWSVPEATCPCGAHLYATYDNKDGLYHAFEYFEPEDDKE